jgi:hypothetical protein
MTQAQNVAELSSDINSSGVLQVIGGGTGATTTTGAANAILPSQTSNTGKYLTTNGTDTSWGTVTIPVAFPSGTVLLFYQSAAPTGWTQVTTAGLNDSALRVVTSAGGGTGGTVGFTTAFASQTPAGTVSVTASAGTLAVSAGTLATGTTTATGSVSLSGGGSVSAYTLSTSEIPAHAHSITTYYDNNVAGTAINSFTQFVYAATNYTNNAGGGGSHAHGFSNPSYSFTGTGHNHTITGSPTLSGAPSITSSTFTGTAINLAVKYLNIILCSKD